MKKFELKVLNEETGKLEVKVVVTSTPARIIREMYELNKEIEDLEKEVSESEDGSVSLATLKVHDLKVDFIANHVFKNKDEITSDFINDNVTSQELNNMLENLYPFVFGVSDDDSTGK